MQKVLRTLAVLSSLALLSRCLYYQTSLAPKKAAKTPEPEPQTQLGLTEEAPEASSTPVPKVAPIPSETFIFSTKSGRIITPSATPAESRPKSPPKPFLPSSKSRQIVLPQSVEKADQQR